MSEGISLELKPSEQVVFDAKQPFTATDSRGRRFTLCKPGLLSEYRITELVGAELAKNRVYMGMIMPIRWVQSIDGDAVTFRTKRELEALISRVDEEGLQAILDKMIENGILPKDGEEGKEEDANASKEDLKNV